MRFKSTRVHKEHRLAADEDVEAVAAIAAAFNHMQRSEATKARFYASAFVIVLLGLQRYLLQ